MSDPNRPEADARALLDPWWSALSLILPAGGSLMWEELPLDDPWDPGVSELNLLARPFMERAGLDELDVFVELWDGDEKLRGLPDQHKGRPSHRPPVWFDSVVEGLCIFAAEEQAVQELRPCVASMASSVAAAFLDQHLEASSAAPPEVWDVTAVALGFIGALLPQPPRLSSEEALAVLAEVCRRTSMDPASVELAIAPRWHPTFLRLLTDA